MRKAWASRGLALAIVACGAHVAAAPCPTDNPPRGADVALTVQAAAAPPLALSAADLAALPQTSLTQKLVVNSSAGAATERSLVYGGVLLRDVLLKAGFGGPNDRGARTGVVETVATDGYRAVFSWGELFNAGSGEQVLVITAQDGRALDEQAGPLALRALGDLRPGPRHVRNLCAVIVRGPR